MSRSPTATVRIEYRRPPDREEIFEQTVIERSPGGVVTFLEATPLARPLEHDGHVLLEDGAPAVWFTFPGEWHDIGRFHLRDGSFTGFYANILTPVQFVAPDLWRTTDLFLDVWLPAGGEATVLDRTELTAAVEQEWVEEEVAERAASEAERLRALASEGKWPPAVVHEWTLERVLHASEQESRTDC